MLVVNGLKKYFPIRGGITYRVVGQVKALDGVDFSVRKGEILGLVGESGCGKTTTGRLILGLYPPTAGNVQFMGEDIHGMDNRGRKELRRHMQIIFQDPYASLNPRMTVGDIIGEPLLIHDRISGKANQEQVTALMETVGLDPGYLTRYPHEFSGGQRQRIGIARAIALNPQFVICDEPVSALDVSIQAQVINLLQDLHAKLGLTFLFISHDLSVIRHISSRVAVMYLGKILEIANTDSFFSNPLHPYTKALLSAVPIPDPTATRQQIVLSGDVPSPINPPSGCRFHTRCYMAQDICAQEEPMLSVITKNHEAACHFVEKSG